MYLYRNAEALYEEHRERRTEAAAAATTTATGTTNNASLIVASSSEEAVGKGPMIQGDRIFPLTRLARWVCPST